MKLTPAMRSAAKLFGAMGGRAATNQKQAAVASWSAEARAKRAKNGASRRIRKSTEKKKA
jgi:hypothetical protein